MHKQGFQKFLISSQLGPLISRTPIVDSDNLSLFNLPIFLLCISLLHNKRELFVPFYGHRMLETWTLWGAPVSAAQAVQRLNGAAGALPGLLCSRPAGFLSVSHSQ